MVTLYKAPKANQVKNTTLSKQLLHICIDIENIFGILRESWKSLTGLRLILTSEKKYELAYM